MGNALQGGDETMKTLLTFKREVPEYKRTLLVKSLDRMFPKWRIGYDLKTITIIHRKDDMKPFWVFTFTNCFKEMK